MKPDRGYIILTTFILLLIGGGTGAVYGLVDYHNVGNGVDICGEHICLPGEFELRQAILNDAQRGNISLGYNFTGMTGPHISPIIPSKLTFGQDRPNYIMDIHIPNHVDYFGVVLSYDDFQKLKNNIGVFAAVGPGGTGPITTTNAPTNIDYCVLANAIWNGQDASFQAKYSKDLVVPPYCNATPIPEYGNLSFIVMSFSIIMGIIITGLKNKTRLR